MYATQCHCLPYSVKSDNGPRFVAVEFEVFLEYLGIQHKKRVPYRPQSNGEVERFNVTMMKVIWISEVERKYWKEEMQKLLFQYRTTPHTVMGVSQAEMLMGQQLRNKLPKMQMRAAPMAELQCKYKFARAMREERDMRKSMPTRRGALRSALLRLAIE